MSAHVFGPKMFVVENPFVIRHYTCHDEWADFFPDEDGSHCSGDNDDEEDVAWVMCQERENSCKIASQQEVDDIESKLQQTFGLCPQPAKHVIRRGEMCFSECFSDDISPDDLHACAVFFDTCYKHKIRHRHKSQYYNESVWTQNSERLYALNSVNYAKRNIYQEQEVFDDDIRGAMRFALSGNIIVIGRLEGSAQIACACMLMIKGDVDHGNAPIVWSAEVTNVCAYPFGQGRGAHLMEHVKSFYFRNKQLAQLVLHVEIDEDYEKNCRFYAKAGFHIKRLPTYMTTEDCLRMVYDATKTDPCEYSMVYGLPGSLVRNPTCRGRLTLARHNRDPE